MKIEIEPKTLSNFKTEIKNLIPRFKKMLKDREITKNEFDTIISDLKIILDYAKKMTLKDVTSLYYLGFKNRQSSYSWDTGEKYKPFAFAISYDTYHIYKSYPKIYNIWAEKGYSTRRDSIAYDATEDVVKIQAKKYNIPVKFDAERRYRNSDYRGFYIKLY